MASGRERVEAALRLEVADRPPVSAWGHDYDQEWEIDSLVAATVAKARRFGFDFVKLQIRATCFAEAFGARWRYSGSPVAEPVMESAGGAGGDFDPAPLRDQVEALRRVVRELGPEVPVLQTVFSPGMVAWFLAGRDLAELARQATPEWLAEIARALAWFTTESLEAGAAGVFYAINPLAGVQVVEPAEYERLYLPADRVAVAAAAGGWFNMLHLCGPHINTRLVDQLRMQCVNWSIHDAGNPGLAELRGRHHVAVAGGIQRDAPIKQAPDEMRGAVRAALDATRGRGHLLTPGCSTSPWREVQPPTLEVMLGS
ncbi:MAG TPA: uroporphyrinogen decarboxylase family protein [Candidatus Dormibacteraeota bacterium]